MRPMYQWNILSYLNTILYVYMYMYGLKKKYTINNQEKIHTMEQYCFEKLNVCDEYICDRSPQTSSKVGQFYFIADSDRTYLQL